MSITPGTVALTGPGLYGGHQSTAHLDVEGPVGAGIVIHAPYAYVEVRDLAGPVRVAATHARARVLDTTGPVDVTAGVVDFAGSGGAVNLSAEMEINLQLTTREFAGTLTAWAEATLSMMPATGIHHTLYRKQGREVRPPHRLRVSRDTPPAR